MGRLLNIGIIGFGGMGFHHYELLTKSQYDRANVIGNGKIVRCINKDDVWTEQIVYTKAGPTKTMAPRNENSIETIAISEPIYNFDVTHKERTDKYYE